MATVTTPSHADRLRRIQESVEQARAAVRSLHEWFFKNVVANDVFPRELPMDVRLLMEQLMHDLDSVSRERQNLSENMFSRPTARLLGGFTLTYEEYYFLKAGGVTLPSVEALCVVEVDEYDVFSFLCYEDEHLRCYIDVCGPPPERPAPGELRRLTMRWGHPPEDLDESALRPDQRRFFKERFPDIYRRFRVDKSVHIGGQQSDKG